MRLMKTKLFSLRRSELLSEKEAFCTSKKQVSRKNHMSFENQRNCGHDSEEKSQKLYSCGDSEMFFRNKTMSAVGAYSRGSLQSNFYQ